MTAASTSQLNSQASRLPHVPWTHLDEAVDRVVAHRIGAAARDIALADALRTIAAAMRAGATIQQALLRAADRGLDPVANACASAAARISLGRPVEAEIDEFARRVGTPAARLFAQVVRVQHRRGGDLGGPCHRLATLLHDRIRLDAEARSATAQARFSARAVLAIPALLALAAAWRAPDATRQFLEPGPLLLASPGIALICVGAIVARRIAVSACSLGAGTAPSKRRSSWIRSGAHSLAGSGPRSRAGARLGALATACCAPALVASGFSPISVLCTAVSVGVAVSWPWSERARTRRARALVAQSGIEALLEVSIALFAAGATAHEVATLAPGSTPEPLRSALAPAVYRVGLGRTIAAAYDAVPEMGASAQLDGWLHAICTSAELGAPASDVLEQLLRDARSARREQLRSVAQTAAPRMQLALVLLVVPGVMWLMLLATVGGLVNQLQASGVV